MSATIEYAGMKATFDADGEWLSTDKDFADTLNDATRNGLSSPDYEPNWIDAIAKGMVAHLGKYARIISLDNTEDDSSDLDENGNQIIY